MHIAVLIVGFRNTDDIVRCVQALGRSEHQDFEIRICENGGSDAYAALLAALPATLPGGQKIVVNLATSNGGFAGGVNIALRGTPGADAWWVLNPDTEPSPEAMSALVARLRQGDCQAVGSRLILPGGTVQSYGGLWRTWLARAESIGIGASASGAMEQSVIERRQNYLNGASMLFGKDFLATAGTMREDYFLYCEEVEWCLRARMRGMKLGFAPGADVLHYQGTTTGNTGAFSGRSRVAVYLGERNKMLITRDLFPARLPLAAVAAFLQIFARYARRQAWRQVGYGISGWAAGLAGSRGKPDFIKT